MSEEVGVNGDVQPLPPGPVGHAVLHRASTQASAITPDEERRLVRFDDCAALPHPLLQGLAGFAAYWNDALLLALADDPDGAVRQEVGHVEPYQLREPQPG